MKTAMIIHGAYGHPQENWFPWLKTELERVGYTVFVPQFPTPENQNLEAWTKVFEQYKDSISDETILIGHSVGVAFILSMLEKHKVKAAFLVAGFLGSVGNRKFDPIMTTFTERAFDWDSIRNNCKEFHIYFSDDDPYVKPEKATELGILLGTRPILIKDAGHFNEKAGYVKFERLLEDIKKE